MDALVGAMRRFAVDFFTAHDPSVCATIMSDDYTLTVGRHVISGRDAEYMPAVERQLAQFPGLAMTVHALVAAPGRAALHFSEHGASGGSGGPVAVWTGVALFHWDGLRLTTCFAAEDYQARRRQIKNGISDPVRVPAPAPWDTEPAAPDIAAESVVRHWLESPTAATDRSVSFDDEHLGTPPLDFVVSGAEVLDLFSAGVQVAYAVVHQDVDGHELFSAGIVTVADGAVVAGHAVRDRLALARAISELQR